MNSKQKLSDIEQKENVRIIYACESGSRAWGFESEDSDYDVRFVYVRNAQDYLRLEEKRDVIEAELNAPITMTVNIPMIITVLAIFLNLITTNANNTVTARTAKILST